MIKGKRLAPLEEARLLHMSVSELCDQIADLLAKEASLVIPFEASHARSLLIESEMFRNMSIDKLREAGHYHRLAEACRPKLTLVRK